MASGYSWKSDQEEKHMNTRNPLKIIFNSRLFWIIFSLLASLSIWTYVVSTESSDVSKIFSGIPLQIIGDDSLLSNRNLVITDLETQNVRVEIRGPRRIVDALESDDLEAQVDVSRLTRPAYATMKYKLVYPDSVDTRGLSESKYYPETISFQVSMLNTISIPVRGGFDGDLADGYTAEAPVFEPSTITVSGPETYLKDVAYAWVSFGTGISAASTYSVDAAFVLMDSEGNSVSTEYLTCSDETINATLPILMVKDVSLSIDLIEGAGATSANTKVTVEPDHITLAGDSAILDGINKIVLSTIDLTDFRSSFTETYPIAIENSLRNVTGVTEAKVSVEIVGLSTKTFTVKNISLINVPESLEAEIISEGIGVVIRGTEEQLMELKAENIRAVADLADYKDSTGTYMANARIYVDGFVDVGAIGTYPITVNITKA